ncbi:MAG: UvrD-helicase domain-containing protein [Clostridia bacterium]|nr:UvrD-helicase domain-containing protein [Clostridia bacterium]
MPRWTEEQQQVLDARSDTLLVSAAAGSGKTAVLVERVYRLLQQGADIERMLIVTFTRAAAGEMRERIEKRLSGETDPHLKRQAAHIHRAMISTLHSFCQKFLREQFAAAGIDPMFRLGSEHELMPLREKALAIELENACAEPTDEEQALFSSFEDEEIVDMASRLRNFLLSRADPFDWALEKTHQGLEPFLAQLRGRCRQQLSGAVQLLSMMNHTLNLPGAPLHYQDTYLADEELTRALIDACEAGTLTDGPTAFTKLSAKRKTPDMDEGVIDLYKRQREEWKKVIKEARALLPANLTVAQETYAYTLAPLRALIKLVQRVENRYFELKKRRNLLDFSDLEHLTLKVLKNESVRLMAAKQFDYLFVDEYQDVSGIQEAIVSALHVKGQNQLFLVGDVKQSIYRFRLADPTLFLHKYDTFSEDESAADRKILLSRNFRSTENVLFSTNHVFAHAMRKRETEIDYDESAMLRVGGSQEKGVETELAILQRESQDEDTETEGEMPKGYLCEARYIARRIHELMENDSIPDEKNDSRRRIRFKDIVILLRNASNRASDIAKLLEKEGIPVYTDADGQYFDLPEVRDMLSLLRVIVNPEEDLALLSALRCPCFDFSEEHLSRIRLTLQGRGIPFHKAFYAAAERQDPLGERCRRALDKFSSWRFLSGVLPLDTFIWRLMEESSLYLRAGAAEDSAVRKANLRLFAERAQGDNARLSVAQFLTAMDDARRAGDKTGAKTLGENEDVVRIMTLHKSKGLQFPVVFIMEMSRPFRTEKDAAPLLMDEHLGCALRYVDGENRLTRTNPAMDAIREKSDMQHRAEECRLLYVGMTRAQYRLIMTASPKNFESAVMNRESSAYRAGSAKCMLDWVADALGSRALAQEGYYTASQSGSRWHILFPQAARMLRDEDAPALPIPPFDLAEPDQACTEQMQREKAELPVLKTSVTALVHHMLREAGDEEETPGTKRRELRFDPADRPRFLQEQGKLTGAERGTAIHRALGLLPLNFIQENRFADAVRDLATRGVFSPREMTALSSPHARKAMQQFYLSDLGKRMLCSSRIEREWSFTWHLHSDLGEYVQGTIDLCFMEDGQWILCDYKTDALDEEALKDRYQKQLQLYARALTEITGIPVKEMHLYSLHLNKAVSL